MTPEEFAAAMREHADLADPEDAHGRADALMMNMLRELGYGDGVEIFKRMTRWYA